MKPNSGHLGAERDGKRPVDAQESRICHKELNLLFVLKVQKEKLHNNIVSRPRTEGLRAGKTTQGGTNTWRFLGEISQSFWETI